MIGVRTTAAVGTVFRVGSQAGELLLTVMSAFQLPALQVELPPSSQFRITTHNAGIQQFAAGGAGNALACTVAPLTFFTIAENSAGQVTFEMDGGG